MWNGDDLKKASRLVGTNRMVKINQVAASHCTTPFYHAILHATPRHATRRHDSVSSRCKSNRSIVSPTLPFGLHRAPTPMIKRSRLRSSTHIRSRANGPGRSSSKRRNEPRRGSTTTTTTTTTTNAITNATFALASSPPPLPSPILGDACAPVEDRRAEGPWSFATHPPQDTPRPGDDYPQGAES